MTPFEKIRVYKLQKGEEVRVASHSIGWYKDPELDDLESKLAIFWNWAYNSLDNSLKQHLQLRKVQLHEEIVAGFDTEYVPIDYGRNDLVSGQVSVTTVGKVEVPLERPFAFEVLNTVTSQQYLGAEPGFKDLDFVKGYIVKNLRAIRRYRFGDYDGMLKNIVNKLGKMKCFSIITKKADKVLFQFKKPRINNVFIKPVQGERLEIYMKTLLNIILGYSKEVQWFENFCEFLGGLGQNHPLVVEVAEKREDSWNGKTLLSGPVQEVELSNKDNELLNFSNKKERKEKFSNIVGQEFPGRKFVSLVLCSLDQISHRSIDILKKSFSTITSPILSMHEIPVYIRDTLCLSSAAAASLEAVAKGHSMQKISIPERYKSDMKQLFADNYQLFRDYAMSDSLITLVHALFMSDFNFSLGAMKVPLTLGALCSKYLKNKWAIDGYKGHQPNSEFQLGSVQATHTSKGINSVGFAAENENLYLASFRGGRNECFSYGVDRDRIWYDYDLASCYATIMSQNGDPVYYGEQEPEEFLDPSIMSLMGDPNYSGARLIYPTSSLGNIDFKNSYSAIKVKFRFPDTIKYPPLPVFMDKTITIYPRSGETIVTGPELLSAKNILEKALSKMLPHESDRYFIEIILGSYIPFRKDGDALVDRPFFSAIQELQLNRKNARDVFGKGSALERIYKDLGNMIYGKTVCGISNKRSFDPRTLAMKSMIAGPLSNPIVGGWITGFVRALIAELLNAVEDLGGNVTACTTDGFTCDIPDLENKVLAHFEEIGFKNSFLQDYRNSRDVLTGGKDPAGLELKTTSKGLIQWSTRGQLSIDHSASNVPIAAMTGFQKYQFDHAAIQARVEEALASDNKIYYLQKRLTGARDFAQVSYVSSLRLFRTVFDSKRCIIPSDNSMLFTSPWDSAQKALEVRFFMRKFANTIYSSALSREMILAGSMNSREECLKTFVRLLLGYTDFNIEIYFKTELVQLLNRLGTGTKFAQKK
ncbi:hypothetical protein HOY80DRAFT_1141956 [Tuber brumale]|nr:hypothetical protein HOY80DRAFT_1141956 [Tuber brumale]